jgi:hypothetical protein
MREERDGLASDYIVAEGSYPEKWRPTDFVRYREGFRVRVKGGNVMLCIFDGETLISTFHYVSWPEIIRWGII